MSKNLKDDWAKDAMHEAYAARTMALDLPLEVATNGWSLGNMYSENR